MVFPGYARPSGPDPVNPQDLATKNYVDVNHARTYLARVYRAAAFTFSATANTIVNPFIYDTISQGSASYYNIATGLYTCPVTGVYLIVVRNSISAAAQGNILNVSIWLNSTQIAIGQAGNAVAGGNPLVSQCTALVGANAGDTLNGSASTSLASAALRNNIIETSTMFACIGQL